MQNNLSPVLSNLSINGNLGPFRPGCFIYTMMLKSLDAPLPLSSVSLHFWLPQHLLWNLIMLRSVSFSVLDLLHAEFMSYFVPINYFQERYSSVIPLPSPRV